MNDSMAREFRERCEVVGQRGLDVRLYDDLIDSRNEELLDALEAMSDEELSEMWEFPMPAFRLPGRRVR